MLNFTDQGYSFFWVKYFLGKYFLIMIMIKKNSDDITIIIKEIVVR
jgi:hypothetical protein